MKDEIKEILEYMKKVANKNEEDFESELSHRDCALLLDYITNLEQEVQDLKADYGSKSQVERDLLEQENERLKDSLETMTFTAKVKQEAVDSLISRIDKAIEYIKRYESIRAYYEYQDGEYWETDYDDDFQEDLLNILTGGDE